MNKEQELALLCLAQSAMDMMVCIQFHGSVGPTFDAHYEDLVDSIQACVDEGIELDPAC